MSELKHWLDDASEADDFERSILRAGLDADPPQAKQEQIWTGLMASLVVSPLAATTTSAQVAGAKATAVGVSKAATVWLAVGKGFLVGLAIYGAAQGVSEISSRLDSAQAPAATAQRSTAPAQTMSGLARLLPAPPPELPAASDESLPEPRAPQSSGAGVSASTQAAANSGTDLPSVATFADSAQPNSARVSQLEAEARALRQARTELRAGKLADAFATLEAARRQFPAPELYQEREALMIELLYRSGQTTAAKQRASAFLSRFPESPHAQSIRRQFGGNLP